MSSRATSKERRSSRRSNVLGLGEVARVEGANEASSIDLEYVEGTSRVAVERDETDALSCNVRVKNYI